MITVFTPSYNRAHLLTRLYDSLKQQTYKDFEWIVVDDGSSDNTKEVMTKLMKEGAIFLRFYSQENGGKHMATNRGIAEAKGELFFNVDSDDYLTTNALQEIASVWQDLSNQKDFNEYLGVGANRITPEGYTIGGEVNYDTLDTNMSAYRYKYFIKGDKSEAVRTDVLKKHPFPYVKGEKFCSEGYLWNYLSRFYKLRYINKGICICTYLDGGITSRSITLRYQSPNYASLLYLTIITNKNVPLIGKLKESINYWRFNVNNRRNFEIEMPKRPSWIILMYPFGLLYHLYDKIRRLDKPVR